uniref:Uncharacterized protein n=1 Tax=Panagrolaimus sp. JU765 TaxID=591449 RepID=A0AC34Q2R4_9BILA
MKLLFFITLFCAVLLFANAESFRFKRHGPFQGPGFHGGPGFGGPGFGRSGFGGPRGGPQGNTVIKKTVVTTEIRRG